MRNLAENWPRIPDWQNAVFERRGISVKTVIGLRQHLVSGNLAPFDTDIGALGVATGDSATIRVARDRVLVVNGDPALLTPGWHDSFGATDVSAMFHVFEISGDGIPALLGEALTLDPENPSPSASVVFAGLHAILYCVGNKNTLRLHVECGFATHFVSWLEARD